MTFTCTAEAYHELMGVIKDFYFGDLVARVDVCYSCELATNLSAQQTSATTEAAGRDCFYMPAYMTPCSGLQILPGGMSASAPAELQKSSAQSFCLVR